jgi:hypothetical protein
MVVEDGKIREAFPPTQSNLFAGVPAVEMHIQSSDSIT